MSKIGIEQARNRLKKFKATVNEAMVCAVHNVPPVPGTTVFLIRKSPQRDTPEQKKRGIGADLNVQALVLAATAMVSCQDAVFYFYEGDPSRPESSEAPLKYVELSLDRKVPILEMVKTWLAKKFKHEAQNPATLFDLACSESRRNAAVLDKGV